MFAQPLKPSAYFLGFKVLKPNAYLFSVRPPPHQPPSPTPTPKLTPTSSPTHVPPHLPFPNLPNVTSHVSSYHTVSRSLYSYPLTPPLPPTKCPRVFNISELLIKIIYIDQLDKYDGGVRQVPFEVNTTKPTAGIWATYPQNEHIETWQCFVDQVSN